MKNEEREEFVQAVVEKYLIPVLKAKGNDYSRQTLLPEDNDTNANFKKIAERLKGAPMDKYTVLAVYYEKHILALETWINTRKLESEKLDGRLTDLINYPLILWGMLAEDGLVPEVNLLNTSTGE